MATWVLADPHAGAIPEADEALLALLDRAHHAGVDLLLMGDLFVAWIAVDRFLTDLQRRILRKLEAIRESGASIRFVTGNRDYLPERLVGRAFDQVYGEETVVDLDGVPTMIAHGDRLNREDRPYLAWRRLSRSTPVTAALSRLPGSLGARLAAGVERRMRGINSQYKAGPLPMDGLSAIAERADLWGAKRVLLGHFHTPTRLDLAVPVVIAPGWFAHREVLDGRALSPVTT